VPRSALFDHYVAVDWSAANSRKTGTDSIWIAHGHYRDGDILPTALQNPPTRYQAMEHIAQISRDALHNDERVLIGFDFPFAYPVGAATLLTGTPGWQSLWRALSRLIEDDEKNRSNRFAVANLFNQRLDSGKTRFWGHPYQRSYSHLTLKRPPVTDPALAIRRRVEMLSPKTKTVWQLMGAGSVGSQALLGIAWLEHLRKRRDLADHIAIWPFETDFADDLSRPIILAEIYPSLHLKEKPDGVIKDRAQVEAVVADFANADRNGTLVSLLARPSHMDDATYRIAISEEGWIVGV